MNLLRFVAHKLPCRLLCTSALLFASPLMAESRTALYSVVKIEVSSFIYSYKNPWGRPGIQNASGTGFVISKNRILTNAHVVSGATGIRVSMASQAQDYPARVRFIAHDCDLAILEVPDSSFFEKAIPLQIGKQPELNTPVEVIGYPIGGDRVSITRGVVSRLGMDVYSHSQVDYHLTIQVDAAINPGNSGGPALQNGKVIGVAFQSLRSGENLGYLIPPVVIRKFLTDIQDGRYDGYIELGVIHQNTLNPTMKRELGLNRLPNPHKSGVLVYAIMPRSSADGFLREGDVLLSINGHAISEKGDVWLNGSLQPYSLVTDNLENGQKIEVEILRNGKHLHLSFPARPTDVILHLRRDYDHPPNFYILGGLLFQPLDANLMQVYRSAWKTRPELLYRYDFFVSGGIYKEVEEDVVLTRRLGDPLNTYLGHYLNKIVLSVNNNKIRNFGELVRAFETARKSRKKILIRFRGEDVPLVLEPSQLQKANARIQKKYGLPGLSYYKNRRRQK